MYSTQEWGYLDSVKTFFADPISGAIAETNVPVRDMQAPPPPRWWQGGALIGGVSCCPHRVDWTGKEVGGVPPRPEGSWVRGSGVSPGGRVALLVSTMPDRGRQRGVDLLVDDRTIGSVTLLPRWPENRGDTHYWPHVQVLWQGEQAVIFPDLDAAFDGRWTWARLDVQTGQTEGFPLLLGYRAAYPSPDGLRWFVRSQEGWAILDEGRTPTPIRFSPEGEGRWAPPIWSEDGQWIYFGLHLGRGRHRSHPEGPAAVLERRRHGGVGGDAAGRLC